MDTLLRNFRATIEVLSNPTHLGFVDVYPRVLAVDVISRTHSASSLSDLTDYVFECTDGYTLNAREVPQRAAPSCEQTSFATCRRHSQQGRITPFEVQKCFSRQDACCKLVLYALQHNSLPAPPPLLIPVEGVDSVDYDVQGEHALPTALLRAMDWAMCTDCWGAARAWLGDASPCPLPPRSLLLLCLDATLLPPWLPLPPTWVGLQHTRLVLGRNTDQGATGVARAVLPVSLWVRLEEDVLDVIQPSAPGWMQERSRQEEDGGAWGQAWYGYEGVKKDLMERVVEPLRAYSASGDPSTLPLARAMSALHVRPPTGLLLYGPTGTGKSTAAREVARAAGCTLLHVVCARLLSRYVGDSEAGIRRLFAAARALSPCILVLDGIEAIAGARQGMEQAVGRGRGGGQVNESMLDRLVATLLAETDGVGHMHSSSRSAAGGVGGDSKGGRGATVCVIGTCTVPPGASPALDAALMRPGRLELSLCVPYAGVEGVVSACEAVAREWAHRGGPRMQVQEGLWVEVAHAITCPPWTLPSVRTLVYESIVQAVAEAHRADGGPLGMDAHHWRPVQLAARHVLKAAREVGHRLEQKDGDSTKP